jgi:prenyltransferase beta subunit
MIRRLISGLVVAGLALAIGGSTRAQETDDTLSAALDYLRTVQGEDGGFSNGFAPESDLGATADAVVAIAAAGEDVAEYAAGDDQTPLDALGALIEAGVADENAGQLAKVITALVAAGEDPSDFNGRDLVSDLLALQGEEGTFGMGAFDHCLSVIALQNAGEPLPDGALDAFLAAQNDDGGWGFIADQASDTNTTGLCLQALAREDAEDAVSSGLDYLASIQNEDGGWPYQSPSDFGTTSDASSTALVVQALIALEEDLTEWNNPQDFLTGLQEESGAFRYQDEMPGDNILATIGAIPALAGVPLNHWAPESVAE